MTARALGIRAGLFLLLAGAAPSLAQTGTAAPVVAAAAVSLEGRVAHPEAFTAADLKALPPTTVEVTYLTEQGSQRATFTGALLWTLLDEAGLVDEPGKRTRLQHTVLARGRDGYAVALAVGEIDPKFEGKQVIVAYAQDGKPMAGLRLVVPKDLHGGRYVRDLVSIEVR